MNGSSGFLAFLAGGLTTLSPCVLPILPLVLGAAGRKDRWAPAFLATGLALSFAIVGWSIAAFGSLAGLETDHLRWISAALLGFFGIALVSGSLSARLSRLLQPLADRASRRLYAIEGESRAQHFFMGGLLGMLWSPCSGPTLGSAVGLASHSASSAGSFFTMLLFGIGAATPLALFAGGLGSFFRKNQQRLLKGATLGRKIMGLVLVSVALLVLTGGDKRLEAKVNGLMPDFLLDLTTRY